MKSATTDNDSDDASGLGCGVLLALVLASAGVFTAWLLISTTADWFAARSWVRTECVLKSAELVSDDGNYSIKAAYRYRFGGKQFSGHRASLYGGSDSVGPFQHRKFRELDQALKQGGNFHCFVDPSEPSDSVLFRDFRPGLFVLMSAFPPTFGLLGFAGLIWYRLEYKRLRFRQLKRAESPDEPWTWREDWNAGVIKPVKRGFVRMGVLAVVVNGMIWPWTILMPGFIGVVGLPLCVLGIVMAWHAVRAIRSLYRLRNARLQLDYPTGVRGIGISGQIFLPVQAQPDSGFLVSLTVVHRIKRKDNDGDDVHTEAARGQWQQRVLATKCEGGMEVVFRFPISKRYRDLNDNRPIIWTVELLTSPPHVGCDLHFEVPVFSVPSSNWQLPEKLPSEQTQLVTLGECLERNRGTVLQQGPDKHIVELGSPKKWYGGEEPAYRLEYDRERIEVSGGGNPRVQIATCDVEKIGRRLSGYAKSISDLPFGFPRERYEVEVLMSDQTRHTLASFERLADAKELIRSMRRVTAIRTKTLPDNP